MPFAICVPETPFLVLESEDTGFSLHGQVASFCNEVKVGGVQEVRLICWIRGSAGDDIEFAPRGTDDVGLGVLCWKCLDHSMQSSKVFHACVLSSDVSRITLCRPGSLILQDLPL